MIHALGEEQEITESWHENNGKLTLQKILMLTKKG